MNYYSGEGKAAKYLVARSSLGDIGSSTYISYARCMLWASVTLQNPTLSLQCPPYLSSSATIG